MLQCLRQSRALWSRARIASRQRTLLRARGLDPTTLNLRLAPTTGTAISHRNVHLTILRKCPWSMVLRQPSLTPIFASDLYRFSLIFVMLQSFESWQKSKARNHVILLSDVEWILVSKMQRNVNNFSGTSSGVQDRRTIYN